MPVLDIRIPADRLWDQASGVYVFGEADNCLQRGSDWERAAQIVFYDGSTSPVFVEETGLRINGGWSRRFRQKGLRFYFDDYGSDDQLEYDFFGTEPASFRRLIMRCALEPRRCFTDILASETFAGMGHLTSRWAPLAVYLNGEYWGFQPLRERMDEEFIEHTHNIDNYGYALIKDGETTHGDSSSFWNFLDECLAGGNFSSHDFFVHAEETIDLISYIDWLVMNIYGASTDNGSPANSVQYQIGSQPWQYTVWDEDGLFYLDNYWANYFHFLSINSLEEYNQYKPDAIFTGTPASRIRWAAPFRALLQNSQFKQLFANRYRVLMNTELSRSHLDARLDGIVDRQESEMALHGQRWNWPTTTWYQTEADQLHYWFLARPTMLNSQFEEFMEEYRVPVELVDFYSSGQNSSGVFINWKTDSEENCAGFVLYRGEEINNLSPLVSWVDEEQLVASGGVCSSSQYLWFDSTVDTGVDYFYQLAWVDFHGREYFLDWTLQYSTVAQPELCINEFLASNLNGIVDETGVPEDWVEIYNQGPGEAHLGGFFLTDNLALPMRWEFPDTTLAAGDFLLVWCDSDPEDGLLHTNFKLSASGETIAILGPLSQGNPVLDEREFGPQISDVSEGRLSDGHSQWINYDLPTPGAHNFTPVAGIPDEVKNTPILRLDSISPNPCNPSTRISFYLDQPTVVRIGIYSLSGALVRRLCNRENLEAGPHDFYWNGRGDGEQVLSSGPYLVQISHDTGRVAAKILLIK